LAAVLTAGALMGGLGRAFFVPRDEYTTLERSNAVDHKSLQQTLDTVSRALEEQTRAINEMAKSVQAQAVELARVRK